MSAPGKLNSNFRHGHAIIGEMTPTYRSWYAAKTRCLNANHPQWKDYGGRGISMCARWRSSFAHFLEDMGERPDGCSLDRIDSNRDYEPGNCRWADRKTQNRNSRRVVLTQERKDAIQQLHGSMSHPQIAKHVGVSVSTVNRLIRGVSWA